MGRPRGLEYRHVCLRLLEARLKYYPSPHRKLDTALVQFRVQWAVCTLSGNPRRTHSQRVWYDSRDNIRWRKLPVGRT